MIARLDRLRRSPLGLAVLHVARVYAVGLAVLKVDQAVRRYHGAPPAQLVATVATTPTKVDPPEPTFDELLDDLEPEPEPDERTVKTCDASEPVHHRHDWAGENGWPYACPGWSPADDLTLDDDAVGADGAG